jgi:hypothetical protein
MTIASDNADLAQRCIARRDARFGNENVKLSPDIPAP